MASGGNTKQEHSRELLRQLSHQSSSDGGDSSVVGEELELLSNVYFEDLNIDHSREGGAVLEFHIAPHTADDKDKQYVYLNLTVTLPSSYPNSQPVLKFNQSRGLSDAHLRGMLEGLQHKMADCLGSPMVYELVEFARECLTDNNRPCGECAVCLCTFEDEDSFTRTDCYHYFHVSCLATFVEFFNAQLLLAAEEEEQPLTAALHAKKKTKQLECPVCREHIPSESACLEAVRILPSVANDDVMPFNFCPSDELRAWQAQMSGLLRRQQSRGGVIDTSRWDDVIDENWVSTARQKRKVNAQPDTKETAPHPQAVLLVEQQRPADSQKAPKESQTSTTEKRSNISESSPQQLNHKPRKPYYSHSRGGRHSNYHRGNGPDRGQGHKASEKREGVRSNYRGKKNGYRTHDRVPATGEGGEEGVERSKREQTRNRPKSKNKDSLKPTRVEAVVVGGGRELEAKSAPPVRSGGGRDGKTTGCNVEAVV